MKSYSIWYPFSKYNIISGLAVDEFYEYHFWFRFYWILMDIIAAIGVVSHIAALPMSAHDIVVLCVQLSPTIHVFQIFCKVLLLHNNRKQIYGYIHKVESLIINLVELSKDFLSEKEVIQFLKSQTRQSRMILFICFWYIVIATSVYFIPTIIIDWMDWGTREIVLPMRLKWFNLDMSSFPFFHIGFGLLIVLYLSLNARHMVMSSSVLFITLLNIAILKLLKTLLLRIWLSDPRSHKQKLRNWIVQYQKVLRLNQELVRLLSPYFVTEFIYICAYSTTLLVITSASSWTLPQKFSVANIVGTNLILFLSFCRVSDHLKSEGETMFLEIDPFNMIVTPNSFDKCFYTMSMERVKKIGPLRMVKFIPITSQLFLSIMRTIITYYMALIEVQKLKTLRAG